MMSPSIPSAKQGGGDNVQSYSNFNVTHGGGDNVQRNSLYIALGLHPLFKISLLWEKKRNGALWTCLRLYDCDTLVTNIYTTQFTMMEVTFIFYFYF